MKSLAPFLAASLAVGSAVADPYASDWAISAKSRARLIADGTGQAAFEIALAPGAITYWRDPGDAGVPPTFDFSRSANLASVEVEFPAPLRIPEPDGSEAFGYDSQVVFPIRVRAADPAKPVELELDANYAVCEKVCLPARASSRLSLTPGAPTPFASEIATARARVPATEDAAKLGIAVTPLEGRNWRLCLPDASRTPRDLFVEPPEGWWLTAKASAAEPGRDCFALALRQAPADAAFPAEVGATFTGGSGAVATRLTLAPKT
jgi:DsbC/DsbD-like thiol-disulfide interchange protein